MKLSAAALALFATVSIFAAEPAATPEPAATTPTPTPAPTPTLSAEVQQQLTATLPKFTPQPAAKPVNPFAAPVTLREQSVARAPESQKEGTADPDVLELPKMTVKQQPRPRVRLNESTIMGPKAFNDQLAKKNFSAVDHSVLNKFTLPSWMGGVTPGERAREDYNIAQKEQFLDDVLTISKAVELTDPASAKSLREAAGKP